MKNKEPKPLSGSSKILRDILIEYQNDCDFAEGHRAHSQGRSVADCPYQEGAVGLSGMRQAWIKGYQSAMTAEMLMVGELITCGR